MLEQIIADADTAALRKYTLNYMKRNADFKTNKRGGKRARTSSTNLDVLVNKKVKTAMVRNSDRHWINISSGPTSIDFSGATYDLLNGIDRDTGASAAFTGSSLQPVFLSMRYRCVGAGTYSSMRVIIGQMIRDRGTGPSSVGAFLNSIGNAQAPLTGYNQYGKAWYRVLYDRLHTMVTANNVAETRTLYIPGNKFKRVEFDTGAANPTILSGGIFMIVISDDGAASYPTFEHESNLIYVD